VSTAPGPSTMPVLRYEWMHVRLLLFAIVIALLASACGERRSNPAPTSREAVGETPAVREPRALPAEPSKAPPSTEVAPAPALAPRDGGTPQTASSATSAAPRRASTNRRRVPREIRYDPWRDPDYCGRPGCGPHGDLR
jgi:hypothetical protein